MNIELHEIAVRELVAGYEDKGDEGVVGYGGKLDIRPAYQREFIYKDKQREAVIDSVMNGFPLNVMYWAGAMDVGRQAPLQSSRLRGLQDRFVLHGRFADPTGLPGDGAADDPHACPHGNGCPAKTDASADCTCPIPVIRVDGTGTSLSEQTRFDFPSEAECCCSRPRLFSYARLLRMATFRIDVSPAAFPDSLIEWSASPAGRIRFVGDVRTGRQVSVVGVSTGDVTLTANITGYAGPPPLVRARVMPRTTVPVYAWIVCGTNGVPAVEEPILRGKFPEINRIWDQAGITWQLAEVNFVTNENWLRVSSATNGNYDALCSYGVPHDGVELYCVEETKKSLGMTSMRGAVVEGASSATIYAHEFGHFCDLKDVYTSHIPETILSVSGVAEKDRFSKDWPSNSHEGYYLNGLSQISVLRRLLMHGRYEPGQSDLSAGDVDGLWNNQHLDDHQQTWVDNYELGMVPLGFLEHGNKQPQGE